MKETSTDYVPEGYVHEWTEEDDKALEDYRKKVEKGEAKAILITTDNFREVLELTEEEYQWLISLCTRGQA